MHMLCFIKPESWYQKPLPGALPTCDHGLSFTSSLREGFLPRMLSYITFKSTWGMCPCHTISYVRDVPIPHPVYVRDVPIPHLVHVHSFHGPRMVLSNPHDPMIVWFLFMWFVMYTSGLEWGFPRTMFRRPHMHINASHFSIFTPPCPTHAPSTHLNVNAPMGLMHEAMHEA